MPADATRFLRCALLQLAAGSTFGVLALTFKVVPEEPLFWRLMPAHRELLLFGWLLQAAFGVACWILPRYLDPRRRPPDTARLAVWLLNGGILLAGIGPLLSLPTVVRFSGKAMEFLGCSAFLLHAWPRVRAARVGRFD
jgi:heme/copper-type cytochrome/quinol oxidase subunit 1